MKSFIKIFSTITLIIFTTSSCINDFFSEDEIQAGKPKTETTTKRQTPSKKQAVDSTKLKSSQDKPSETKSQGDYYKEGKPTENVSSQKKQSVTVIQNTDSRNTSANNTLEKEKIKEEYERKLQKQQKKIQELAKRNDELASQTSAKLMKSTYDVKYKESVEEILHYMYVAYLSRKKVSEATLSEAFKKTFTITYCDDRVLETLDNIVSKNNKWLGRTRYEIRFEDIVNPDKTGNELVRKRK